MMKYQDFTEELQQMMQPKIVQGDVRNEELPLV